MTLQILVPLHTYPDGNSVNIAAHAVAVARYLKADVHGLVLNATFPPATSIMGEMIINVDSMMREVTAKCQIRGTALVQALLGGLGLWIAGVPFVAVLTALMFMLAVAQIGAVLLTARVAAAFIDPLL